MLYRSPFRTHTEESLLLSAFLYAPLAAFFVAVFLVKYRIEYLLSLPLFAALFVSYLLRIALKPQSTALAPERLFREKTLLALVLVLAVTLLLVTRIDLPFLDKLSNPHYIEL